MLSNTAMPCHTKRYPTFRRCLPLSSGPGDPGGPWTSGCMKGSGAVMQARPFNSGRLERVECCSWARGAPERDLRRCDALARDQKSCADARLVRSCQESDCRLSTWTWTWNCWRWRGQRWEAEVLRDDESREPCAGRESGGTGYFAARLHNTYCLVIDPETGTGRHSMRRAFLVSYIKYLLLHGQSTALKGARLRA
jgi:hypothetical protein